MQGSCWSSHLASQQLLLSPEGNTAHGFAPLSPLTPLFSQGLILFIAHVLKQKPFQRVSQIVTLSKLFPCSLGAFDTWQKWNISGCKSKGGSKAHRKSLLGSDLTWSGLLSFFMSSPAANISQWNASIWQYPEGEVDYCSSKLHTAAEEKVSDRFTFLTWRYFIIHNGSMKIKSWCTTVSIFPLSLWHFWKVEHGHH